MEWRGRPASGTSSRWRQTPIIALIGDQRVDCTLEKTRIKPSAVIVERDLPRFSYWQEDTMIDNLLDLIGGRRTIKAATERFYQKVLEDDTLRHFFRRTDMAHLRSRQVMFISMLLGGRVYTGKDIRGAHAESRGHGLNDAHFDLFLEYFRAALEEVGVKPENAEKVMKPLESKRRAVVDR